MRRTKIAICFQDLEYRKRFLKCWRHHYEQAYEMCVFTDAEELPLQDEYDIVLLEGMDISQIKLVEKKETKYFYLSDCANIKQEGMLYLYKYQELYKIEQQIQSNLPGTTVRRLNTRKDKKIVGVFSLDMEINQLPFCAMLAAEYGEVEPSILLDLQMASGLEIAETFSLEELIAAVATGNYTKEQWCETILKEKNWDYVSPIKNTQCLVETNKKTYETLIEILKEEFGYCRYIVNFGQMFEGCIEWMSECDEYYLLVSNKECKSRREQAFIEELKRHGIKEPQQMMRRIEISDIYNPYESWREQAERWRWNSIGDQMRWYMKEGG